MNPATSNTVGPVAVVAPQEEDQQAPFPQKFRAIKTKLICQVCHQVVERTLNLPKGVAPPGGNIPYICTNCTKTAPQNEIPPQFDRYQQDPAMQGNTFQDDLREHIGGEEVGRKAFRQVKPRRPLRRKKTPSWVMDDKKLLVFAQAISLDTRGRHIGFDPARVVEVLNLYYRMGLGSGEIAWELGISANAVKCLLKKAKHRSKRVFGVQKTNSDPLHAPSREACAKND